MKTYSYWLDTLENTLSAPKTELPEQTDLTIIGAGITGLTTGIFTAKAGVNVTIIELQQLVLMKQDFDQLLVCHQ